MYMHAYIVHACMYAYSIFMLTHYITAAPYSKGIKLKILWYAITLKVLKVFTYVMYPLTGLDYWIGMEHCMDWTTGTTFILF